jgi:sodium transport system permease protein
MSLLKMFTISIIGLGLTVAAYMTGSIYVSMMMHFINNSVSVLISLYPEQVGKIAPILMEEDPSGVTLIVITLIGIVLAVAGWLLVKGKKEK